MLQMTKEDLQEKGLNGTPSRMTDIYVYCWGSRSGTSWKSRLYIVQPFGAKFHSLTENSCSRYKILGGHIQNWYSFHHPITKLKLKQKTVNECKKKMVLIRMRNGTFEKMSVRCESNDSICKQIPDMKIILSAKLERHNKHQDVTNKAVKKQ